MSPAILAALLVLGSASPPVAPTPAPPKACTSAVVVASPCQGLLVPLGTAKRALACAQVDLPTCRAEAKRDAALCASHAKESAIIVKNLRQRVSDSQPAWYESPWFGVAVGVVVGVVVGAVSVAQLGK